MSNNRISYLSRNFEDYRNEMLRISRQYYGDLFDNFNDASIGSWFVDMFADIADNLSYHIDRSYQETSVNSASNTKSLMNIARNKSLRVPGPKSAIVEVELSCDIPLYGTDLSKADDSFCPYIRRGTLFSTGLVTFELSEDVDFSQQFNSNGMSDRQIIPNRDSNGNIISYKYKKLGIAVAGESKIYKKVISNDNLEPFMSIVLQDKNVLGVDSIIVKNGNDLTKDPSISDFFVDEETYNDKEGKEVNRFFEVDNLVEQYRFGHVMNGNTTVWETETATINGVDVDLNKCAKGKWKRLKNKFITEYTDKWYLKITFGPGLKNQNGEIPTDATKFTQYMMSRMEANDYLGVLPNADSTMFILYRVGGGEMSNIAKDSLKYITYLNMAICGNPNDKDDSIKKRKVENSLKVTNTTPSYGGKDAPSDEEIRYLLKCHNASQNRCVTLKDYEARIMELPAKFGTPFRCCAVEENNKVIIYTLGIDHNAKLSDNLSEHVADNIKEYLRNYRMINDFVEIRSGKVFNVKFGIDVFVDKAYDKSEVVKRVIETVYDFMDIRKHMMGKDIYVGELEKTISGLDGVLNLISLKCYDMCGEDGYSETPVIQQLVSVNECDAYAEAGENYDKQIDLMTSDKVLVCDAMSMFEVKNMNKDIVVNVKTR